MSEPKVTVLMSVLNGEEFLEEAMDSILAQTFGDFEFVIVDNASTDRTPEIIKHYDDRRVVHLRNDKTLNLSQSLNKGLAQAKGEYIARLDADDVALPGRFEKQVSYLDTHPDVALVASACTEFDDAQSFPGQKTATPPEDHDALMAALARDSILAHSSIMFRREAALEIGGYDEAYAYCMDYLLYFRLAASHKLAALSEPLVAVRVHSGQITTRSDWEARRHLEAASAFRDILESRALPVAQRQNLTRYLIVTSMRLGVLFARSFNPLRSLVWIGRGFLTGPVLFFKIAAQTLCRRFCRA